jgi:polyphosphate kinase
LEKKCEINADFLHYPDNGSRTLVELENNGSVERFFNRELSWIAFNDRVLEEASNSDVPLLERVRFLAISAENLDEFYTVRVAGLKEMVRGNMSRLSIDGLSPAEQIEKIERLTSALMHRQQAIWKSLALALQETGISILTIKKLRTTDVTSLKNYFTEHVFPLITPLAIDPAHPFPFIASGGFTMAIRLRRISDGTFFETLIPIPSQIPRFHQLSKKSRELRFFPLEDILDNFLPIVFPGYDVVGKCVFRILRNSDLELEEEAEDLVREFETALKKRRRGDVVRLTISNDAPKELFDMVTNALSVLPEEIIQIDGIIGMSDLSELVTSDKPNLLWKSFKPRIPERIEENHGDIFATIRRKDMLIHHPYESFDVVVRFLQQAAKDPDVVAIRQTLYRTSRNSPIVKALCEAAESGKSVTALVELRARFDEAANIEQSRALERAGAHVVYGFLDIKTHAKMSVVVRKEGRKLISYTHFGTGNYHPITANFYTDLSYFTREASLARDATKVFNYVSGYIEPGDFENISLAPLNLKKTILDNLTNESICASKGLKAVAWIKLNSLLEKDVIDAMYAASNAGVKIDLVIRGICGLRPGIKGLSENIRVKSIVGRFLEHSRIACFGNGNSLPSSNSKVYISSADWMDRNLNRRVEILVKINNPTVKAQIVSQIMAANLRDQAQSWVLQGDGSYLRDNMKINNKFSCHEFLMQNPSLSGRGRAIKKNPPQLLVDQKIV